MAYDVELAARVRDALEGEPSLTERRMFGGLAFLVGGNLAVSASSRGGLLVRVDPARTDALTDDGLVSRFEMRGRPMSGWLHVAAAAVQSDAELRRWVREGADYAGSLPPKQH
jgi:TfoX/Sxy family transcriptional regulator of competence genes